MTEEELATLAKTLREHDLCGKRGSSRKAVPDEARPSVAIRLEDLDCRVTMLDGEWRDGTCSIGVRRERHLFVWRRWQRAHRRGSET